MERRNSKAFIHIGMPKTGTTALQVFFSNNIKNLKVDGVDYPEFFTPDIGNATSIVGPMVPNGPVLPCPPFTMEMLDGYLARAESDILLSSEWFICLDIKALNGFKEILEKYHFEPIIICYIRRRDKELQSRYCQSFKYKKIDYKCDELVIHQNYVNTLNKFSSVFKKNNIIVKCHEKDNFLGGNIFSDFHKISNIEDLSPYDLPEKKINASPPRHFVNFFRICNKYFDLPDDFRNILIRVGEELGANSQEGEVSWLSPKIRIEVLKDFEAADKRIASDYLNKKDGSLFNEPWPDIDDDWKDPYVTDGEDVIRSIVPLLLDLHKQIVELKTNK